MIPTVSIIIPAYNEAASIGSVVTDVRTHFPNVEVLVIDDGSIDHTGEIARQAGASVIIQPYNKGNGAAVKCGIRAASGDILVMMDGDGQHHAEDISKLLACFPVYDFVIGARDKSGQAGFLRGMGNTLLNYLAFYVTEFPVQDLTSGMRAFRRDMILEYVHLFPNGFSYPTTSTLALLKAGANTCYVPIEAHRRVGTSKIRLLQDGSKFFLIILKLSTLFSPMRIFLPIAIFLESLGIGYSMITLSQGRFTNMATLLILTGIMVFLMGLIAEQLAAIHTQGRRP
ncbi:MAG: glycosyltransferase family 2 protein [Mariprofundales bacterium]